jgi:hypothetical protein
MLQTRRSKPVRSGSPKLGRFDSCAAPFEETSCAQPFLLARPSSSRARAAPPSDCSMERHAAGQRRRKGDSVATVSGGGDGRGPACAFACPTPSTKGER